MGETSLQLAFEKSALRIEPLELVVQKTHVKLFDSLQLGICPSLPTSDWYVPVDALSVLGLLPNILGTASY